MAERRHNAAERWLEYRGCQKEIEKDPSKAKDKDKGLRHYVDKGKGKARDRDDDFSM